MNNILFLFSAFNKNKLLNLFATLCSEELLNPREFNWMRFESTTSLI